MDNQGGENRTMQKMYLLSGLWLGCGWERAESVLWLEMFPVLVLVPLLVTAIVPPHNWSWVHSSIHLSDLVLVLAGGRGSILGCEDEPSHGTSMYPYYAMHALPCFISLFHISVA